MTFTSRLIASEKVETSLYSLAMDYTVSLLFFSKNGIKITHEGWYAIKNKEAKYIKD